MTQQKPSTDTRRVAAVFHLCAAILFAAAPLAIEGFGGFAPDRFPVPQVDVPVQPADYAFAIWGPIYLWLIAGAGYGLVMRADSADWAAMRWPLTCSLVIGAAWIPAAQVSVPVSTVMIWSMWALAVWALLAAGRTDRWWQRAPVALYAGWLTAASCVALGLVLGGYGWMGAQGAAALMLALALGLALAVQWRRRDAPAYTLAVIWALVGVIVANLDPPNTAILTIAGPGAALLAWAATRSPRA